MNGMTLHGIIAMLLMEMSVVVSSPSHELVTSFTNYFIHILLLALYVVILYSMGSHISPCKIKSGKGCPFVRRLHYIKKRVS